MHVAHGWSRSQTSPLKGRTYCIQTENSKHNKRDNLMIEWVFSDWHGLCFKLKKLNSHLVTKKTHLIIKLSRAFCFLFHALNVVYQPLPHPGLVPAPLIRPAALIKGKFPCAHRKLEWSIARRDLFSVWRATPVLDFLIWSSHRHGLQEVFVSHFILKY